MDNVTLINFPNGKVRACTVLGEDGHYTFINSKQAHNRQVESYNHELKHENNMDFGKEDVQAIESYAHK